MGGGEEVSTSHLSFVVNKAAHFLPLVHTVDPVRQLHT
jgi:hypothetical protein